MNSKAFYQQMFAIAIPVALQSLLTSFLNTLDTMMISSLGDASIAGVGLANQVFFLFTLICFGINTGSSVLFAQYWGVRDVPQVRKINQASLMLSTAISVVFMLVAMLFPYGILELFTHDAAVVQAGGDYLRVAALTYVITAWSFSLGSALRSTGNPRVPLIATMSSFVANAFFNYIFIFGKLGLPAMGVVGAALGTVVARMIEIGVLVFVIKRYQGPLQIPIRHLQKIPKEFWTVYWKTTLPVIVNETFWALGQVFYNAAYAMVGTQATAAVQIAVAIQGLAFVIVRGLGSSCSIMLGQSIGKNKIDRAKKDAHRFIILSIITGVAIGAVESLTPQWTLLLFGHISPEVYTLGQQLLQVMGIIFILKTINSVIVVGVLRGGGDTHYGMKLEMSCVWLVGVPLSLLAAGVWHLPVTVVVICAGMEEVTKIVVGFYRVYSKKWIHRLVQD